MILLVISTLSIGLQRNECLKGKNIYIFKKKNELKNGF